ncbi:hypothetical protein MMC18_004713 [Xylographa bjoerkii]|nr:hypothetical protein [Xylographa bjoerkii]
MDHRSLRRTASAPGLETSPLPCELTAETTIPGTVTSDAATTATTAHATTANTILSLLHKQLAANFLQLSNAIEQIKAIEAQLATGKWAGTSKEAKLERKLAGHLQHRDSLGTQRRRLLGKMEHLKRNRGGDL